MKRWQRVALHGLGIVLLLCPTLSAAQIQRVWGPAVDGVPTNGQLLQYQASTQSWIPVTPTPGVPSGLVTFVISGTCPTGYTELTALEGKTLVGTIAASGNVGTTGGSDTITPTGTNSTTTSGATSGGTPSGTVDKPVLSWPAGVPTNASGSYTPGAISWPMGVPTNASGAFTQGAISWPAGVPTMSGITINSFSSVINHTHTVNVTDPGHGHGLTVQGGTTASTTGTHVMTSTATGGSARSTGGADNTATNVTGISATTSNPAGGVASITPTINSQGTIAWPAGVPTIAAGSFTQPTVSWPAGVPTIAAGSFTQPTISWPAGVPTSTTPGFTGSALSTHTHSVPAESFVGDQFDNRSAFIRVIYCQKT